MQEGFEIVDLRFTILELRILDLTGESKQEEGVSAQEVRISV